jgi:hypothetical protein
MKTIRPFLAGALILLGTITASTILPVPAAGMDLFGRVKARMSRQTGLWEIVNSTSTTAVVRYGIAAKGSSDWRYHKAFVPANQTRMLGYDIKYYDLKIVSVDKLGY